LDLVLGLYNAYIKGSHLLTSDAGLEVLVVEKMGWVCAYAPLHVDQHHIAASAMLMPCFTVGHKCRLHLLAV
jgi:hypothetical protein